MTHPCELSDEDLLRQCEVGRQRRSGPGGQHRNKVETAIRLEHRSTGLTAQASERRSQAENQKQALKRLRLELALKYRKTSESGEQPPLHPVWKSRVKAGKLAINPDHADFPVLLAETLNLLSAHHWDHKPVTEILGLSTSQLVKFLKLEPRAFQQFNEARKQQGLKPLQ